MAIAQNPYQAPTEDGLDGSDPFPGWTTWKMVALFFLPALGLIISAVGFIQEIPLLSIGGLIFCGGGALGVIIFSALVHQRRQQAGRGTFLLMVLVYLIAQIFSLFLTIALISMVTENFVFDRH